MKNLLAIIGIMCIGVLISATLILPLSVYVIRDIAYLFKIQMILDISKEAMFGLLIIISILTVKMKKSKKKEESDDKLADLITSMFTGYCETVLFLLVTWGMAYMIHAIKF